MRRKAQHGTATITTMKKSVEFKGELDSIPISLLYSCTRISKERSSFFHHSFIFMHKKSRERVSTFLSF